MTLQKKDKPPSWDFFGRHRNRSPSPPPRGWDPLERLSNLDEERELKAAQTWLKAATEERKIKIEDELRNQLAPGFWASLPCTTPSPSRSFLRDFREPYKRSKLVEAARKEYLSKLDKKYLSKFDRERELEAARTRLEAAMGKRNIKMDELGDQPTPEMKDAGGIERLTKETGDEDPFCPPCCTPCSIL